MTKSYLVEFNIHEKKNVFYGLQKILLDNFLQNLLYLKCHHEWIFFSCELLHKRAVFAHNSSLGWKRSTHRKQRDFPSQKKDVTLFLFKWPMQQISKRKSTFKNTIYHPIVSSLVFTKSISIPQFGFNVCPEFRLCFGNQSSANTSL